MCILDEMNIHDRARLSICAYGVLIRSTFVLISLKFLRNSTEYFRKKKE